MKKTENMIDFCVRVKDVVHIMANMGERISQEHMIQKLLRSLARRWTNVAIIIEERKDVSISKCV